MIISIKPFGDDFATEITGLNIHEPIDDATRDEVISALDRYATVVIRGDPVSEQAQINFALRFGALDTINGVLTTDIKRRVRPELTDVSNMDAGKNLFDLEDRRRLFNLGNRLWHTDSSFKETPSLCSLLYAYEVPPEGGETEFASMRAAYKALDEETKKKIEKD